MLNRIISLMVCLCFFLYNCLYLVYVFVCSLSSTEYSVNKDYYYNYYCNISRFYKSNVISIFDLRFSLNALKGRDVNLLGKKLV